MAATRGRQQTSKPAQQSKPEYDDTNRITVFVSENRDNPKGPSHFGFVNVEGVEYRIALWSQVSKKTGKKFLSGKIQLREDEKPHAANGGFSKADDADPFSGA